MAHKAMKSVLNVFGTFAMAIALLGSAADMTQADASQGSIQTNAVLKPVSAHRFDATLRNHLRCLALNIYWESRSEEARGQLAVAAVTLNRVRDPRFPNSICGVVKQGGWKQRHRCQFSWWCDGKKDEPKDATAWRKAQILARLSYAGVINDPTRGALWYHADYVAPDWRTAMRQTAQIGRHVFYAEQRVVADGRS